MKLDPRPNQILGKIVITKSDSPIVSPDPTANVSKFVVVEAVGANVEGVERGDYVLPRSLAKMFLKGGRYRRVVVPDEEVFVTARDIPLSEFFDETGEPIKVTLDEFFAEGAVDSKASAEAAE